MVYNTQNYLVFGLYPVSRIIETRNHLRAETESVSEMLFSISRIADYGQSPKSQ
jgi:hypothetical protein